METTALKNKTVFLGGTAATSKWRDVLVPLLGIKSFNPVVKDWNEEAMRAGEKAKEEADHRLYVLTPASDSPFSIAEAVQDSNKNPGKTIFCYIDGGEDGEFSDHHKKALAKIATMIEANGAKFCNTLQEVADYLNK